MVKSIENMAKINQKYGKNRSKIWWKYQQPSIVSTTCTNLWKVWIGDVYTPWTRYCRRWCLFIGILQWRHSSICETNSSGQTILHSQSWTWLPHGSSHSSSPISFAWTWKGNVSQPFTVPQYLSYSKHHTWYHPMSGMNGEEGSSFREWEDRTMGERGFWYNINWQLITSLSEGGGKILLRSEWERERICLMGWQLKDEKEEVYPSTRF